MRDLELARSVRPGRTPWHDHGDRYDGHTVLFPAHDLDPGRFDVEEKPGRCWRSWGPIQRSWGAWKARCGDCRTYITAPTRTELAKRMAEHTGDDL